MMYADDIVILDSSPERIQAQMDIQSNWCLGWGMKVNIKKSQVVHHRNHQRQQCKHSIVSMGEDMEYVKNYKYHGCWMNVPGNNVKSVEALTMVAGRSYSRTVGLFKELGDMGYRT